MGWWTDLLSVLYPTVCEVCGNALVDGEQIVCIECMARLPRLYFHRQPDHPFVRRMAAAKVYRVASMFAYVKHDAYTGLILKAKYQNRPDIVSYLSREFATELSREGFFNGIDLILPVPMHAWKLVKRGFNQANVIAQAISEVSGIPVGNHLVALKAHATQTRRNATERMANAKGIYGVIDAETLAGRHVLIVDDVITTGSTILSCCEAVQTVSSVTVSVLSLAATRLGG